MAGDQKIQFDLTLEERQGLRALGKLALATQDFSDMAKKNIGFVSLSFANFFGNLASGLARNALGAFSAQLRQSITAAGDYTKSLAAVNSILPEQAKLTSESIAILKQFSNQFGTQDAQQVKSFYDVVAAGIEGVDNQLSILYQSNKAAIAGLTDVKNATSILASAFNVYSTKGENASTISDKLFAAAKVGQTNFEELSLSMGKIMALSSQAGLTFTDLAGTIGFLTQSGFKTGDAVTSLRSMIANIIKPSEQAAETAKNLGINFSSAAIKAQGFEGFLAKLVEATKGNQQALARLLPDVNGLSAVMAIAADRSGRFSDALKMVENSAGSTDNAFALLENTLGFKLQKLESTFSNFGSRLISTFEPVFVKLIDLVINWVSSFNPYPFIFAFTLIGRGAVMLFSVMESGIQKLTSPLQNLAAALFNIVSVLPNLNAETKKQFGAMAKTINDSFKTPIADALSESMALIGAFALKGAAEFKAIDFSPTISPQIKMGGEGDNEIITSGVNTLWEGIQKQLNSMSDFEIGLADSFAGEFQFTGEQMLEFLKDIEAFSNAVKGALTQGIGNAAGQAFAAFGAALARGENGLDAFVKSFLGSMGDMAIQMGTMFIAMGLGFYFTPGGQALGTSLMAAGAALAAIGGAMKVFMPGSDKKGGGGGGSGGGNFGGDIGPSFNGPENMQANERTAVNLTIMGDIFDSDQTALRISTILEENFDRGILVRSGQA